MTGSALTMAPAFDHPSGLFHRSFSTSDLLSPSFSASVSSLKLDREKQNNSLAHKKLPPPPVFDLDFDIPTFDSDDFEDALSLDTSAFSDAPRSVSSLPAHLLAANTALPLPEPLPEPAIQPPKFASSGRSNSLLDRPRSWLPSSKSATNIRESLGERLPSSPRPSRIASPGRQADAPAIDRRMSMSGSLVNLARRSWMPDPRSTALPPSSPDLGDLPTLRRDKAPRDSSLRATKAAKQRLSSPLAESDTDRSPSRKFVRATSYFSKMKQKPAAVRAILAGSQHDSDNSSTTSSSPSLAPHTSDMLASSMSESNTTVTDDSSIDTPPRVCATDILWPVFHNLDSEFSKFTAAKTLALRIQLVRNALLSVLHRYGNHSSHKLLSAEDVERRAIVLNKWWVALLEMLEGSYPQPLPGIDRILLVEAVTMLMMRPEWRQTTSYFMPLADRSPGERVRARSWTQTSMSSLTSSEAAFLEESASHNVRTMFTTNLVRQMELVVDKMSQRHVTAAMVNFCGKVCAYAFFFAPGVADALTRLWGLTTDQIRRVADEFGLPRRSRGESEDIVALFPPCLGSLGWSAVQSLGTSLKTIPKMPPSVARIPWQVPWLPRWRGRDSDLFFIFCKYYHVLANEFMPDGLPLIEKARAPAFVLVHAQMLAVMDTTIHRQAALEAYEVMPPPFSDGIHGLDASATAMPGIPADLLRGMSENRLIVLLKDYLSEMSADMAESRHTFAESFMSVMKAAARRVSQYNQNACHTLCDFLEEALLAYDGYEDASNPELDYVDWDFWFEACKLILASLNSLSEMRLLSFVYTIWDAITRNPKHKEALCIDWLLTEETFDTFFNHWCPMVRAYYMRLLCWRICRDTGSANEVDTKIFLVVAARLKKTWAHYLYVKQDAELHGRNPPSSAPSYPTPGKKFMILRTELHLPQPGMFMGFDTFAKPTGEVDAAVENIAAKGEGKKRWSLLGLGKMLPFTPDADSPTRSKRPDEDWEIIRPGGETARARAASIPPPPPPKHGKSGPLSDTSSTGSAPIFEAQQFIFRFVLNFYPPAAIPPAERVLSRPKLPAPAQARVSARRPSESLLRIQPGLPPATRLVSGAAYTGLVNEARNASPLSSTDPNPPRMSFSSSTSRAVSYSSDQTVSEGTAMERPSLSLSIADRAWNATPDVNATPVDTTVPVRPAARFMKNVVYTGRAIAEWSIVVTECNNFIDRRREEGVLGLSEVEIPTLAVEGYRRIG